MCNLNANSYYRNKHERRQFDADTLWKIIYIEDIPYFSVVDEDEDSLVPFAEFSSEFYEVEKPPSL